MARRPELHAFLIVIGIAPLRGYKLIIKAEVTKFQTDHCGLETVNMSNSKSVSRLDISVMIIRSGWRSYLTTESYVRYPSLIYYQFLPSMTTV